MSFMENINLSEARLWSNKGLCVLLSFCENFLLRFCENHPYKKKTHYISVAVG